jgi:hypothetical protein
VVAAFMLFHLAWHNWHTSTDVLAGSQYVDRSTAPHELRVRDGDSYDGQFVYGLSLDPFTRSATVSGITLDYPAYRQQRIGLPLLAYALHTVTSVRLSLVLVLIEAVSLVAVGLAGALLMRRFGRHPLWGLLLAVEPGITIGAARDLTEPFAWAALLAGLLCWLDRRWVPAGAAFIVACLTRETSAVLLLGLGVGQIIHGGRRRWVGVAPIATAGAVAVGWQLWLRHVWGALPIDSGPRNVGHPIEGVFDSIRDGFSDLTDGYTHSVHFGVAWQVERLTLVALMVAALLLLARAPLPPPLRCAWAFSAALAVTLNNWAYDAQFLRAAHEAWAMSVLVVVTAFPRGAPLRWLRTVLLVDVAVVSLYVLGFYAQGL